MAEQTNVGMTIFIADITSMCGFGLDGAAAILSDCSFVRCCSHLYHLDILLKINDFTVFGHIIRELCTHLQNFRWRAHTNHCQNQDYVSHCDSVRASGPCYEGHGPC